MACACKKSTKNVKTVSDSEVNALKLASEGGDVKDVDMARMVNFEGQLVQHNSIPEGSLYIKGVWYSSPDRMPEDVREEYKALYQGWKQRNTDNSSASKSKSNQSK